VAPKLLRDAQLDLGITPEGEELGVALLDALLQLLPLAPLVGVVVVGVRGGGGGGLVWWWWWLGGDGREEEVGFGGQVPNGEPPPVGFLDHVQHLFGLVCGVFGVRVWAGG
jgi:hypothetical protein